MTRLHGPPPSACISVILSHPSLYWWTTKSEIPYAWGWRIVAGLWDALSIFLVGWIILILILNGALERNVDEIIAGVLLAVFYPFALLVLQTAVTAGVYPWYLATKAQRKGLFQDYWFGKFRYRLSRFLRRTLRGSRGDLFVRLRVLRLAAEMKHAPPSPVPNLRELLRAFRVRNLETDIIYGLHDRAGPVTAQVDALRTNITNSGTYASAYISYLAGLYLGFTHDEQHIIQDQKEGVWEWLDRSPTRSRFILYLIEASVGLLVALFIYEVFRR